MRQQLIGDVARTAHDIEELRDEARRLEVKATKAAQQFARELTSHAIPVREARGRVHTQVAYLLGRASAEAKSKVVKRFCDHP